MSPRASSCCPSAVGGRTIGHLGTSASAGWSVPVDGAFRPPFRFQARRVNAAMIGRAAWDLRQFLLPRAGGEIDVEVDTEMMMLEGFS